MCSKIRKNQNFEEEVKAENVGQVITYSAMGHGQVITYIDTGHVYYGSLLGFFVIQEGLLWGMNPW